MRALPRTVLELVERLELPLSPRELLAIEELLGVELPEGEDPAEALAVGLASILATDRDTWRQLRERVRAELRVGASPTEEPASTHTPPTGRAWSPPVERRGRRPWGRRVLGAGLLGLVLLALWWAPWPERAPPPPPPGLTEPLTIEGGEAPRAELVQVEPASTSVTETRVDEGPRPALPPWSWALSLGLLLAGALLLRAPASHAAHERHLRDEVAPARRDALRRAKRGGSVPYDVGPLPEALHPGDVDHAAALLSRRLSERPGEQLDEQRTVEQAAEHAGRLEPLYRLALQPAVVLVLVDIERQDHPFVAPVAAVLERWQRAGVEVARFDYHHRLQADSPLMDAAGHILSLSELLRWHRDAPLLLFSRLNEPRGGQLDLEWPRGLRAWARRAWVDLNPAPVAQRSPAEREAARSMERAGLLRFPFTEQGLVAAVEQVTRGERRPPLADPLDGVEITEDALWRWQVAASCVPDPRWDQLEALRQGLPELAEDIPDWRHVQHLLRYVQDTVGAWSGPELDEPIGDNGRILRIEPRQNQRFLTEQRRRDPDRQLEKRARRLLMAQLERAAARVEPGSLPDLRRQLRRDVHAQVVGELEVSELIGRWSGGALHDELVAQLTELETLQSAPMPGESGRRPGLGTEALTHPGLHAPLREVFAQLRRGWGAPVFALGLALPALGLAWALVPPQELHVQQQVDWPAEYQLRLLVAPGEGGGTGVTQPLATKERAQPALGTPLRPELVRISGGTFLMGSAEADRLRDGARWAGEDELPQHEVSVSDFELCATEVSAGMYAAVVGGGCAEDCALPVTDVAWIQVLAYLNELTVAENARLGTERTECYEGDVNQVTWIEGCTGYRLPTEAEWEYAARAGSTSDWSWGEDPADADRYAWFAGNAEGQLHPSGLKEPNAWGLFDMHGNVWEWIWDGYPNTASYTPEAVRDPRGQSNANLRVVRGGSYRDALRVLRSAERSRHQRGSVGNLIGFRCARDLPSGD